ncbi:MAG: hypothetical protein M3537_09745, partial [Chloroflexota bacterium]|nr:hypothetical protein [Chloroflexota bacterium]
DDAVNWPPGMFAPRPGGPSMLMQWCHGAPGVVTALADFPPHRSPDMEAMLIGAGHAIWKAGPLSKGYGLCHGTAGNGYAFLKLYQRTGDPCGWNAHGPLPCIRSHRGIGCGNSTGEDATRCGRATRVLRSTFGIASMERRGCRRWTSANDLRQ